jgi:ADP-ribosylation factor GTPase-activating protein 2/3
MANSYIPDEERDIRLADLLKNSDNKMCFDCKGKNPKWASSTIGIFICYQCTTKHRNMGTHISFCRSIHMDKWKAKELKIMELGGNKKAHTFYAKNSMFSDGIPNHENPALAKYKMQLQKAALAELGVSSAAPSATSAAPAPVPVATMEETKVEDPFFSSL